MEMNEEVSDADGCLEEEYSSDRNVMWKGSQKGMWMALSLFKEQWEKERDPRGINKQGEMRLEKGPGQTL